MKYDRNYTASFVAGLAAFSATVGNHAVAEEATRDEIVITASRVPLKTYQVGNAFTVIAGEDLENRQIRVLSDALRSVPSLALSSSGSVGGLTQIRIRGSEANQVLVVLDGIEVNDPSFGSEFDFSSLLAHEVERIEVLRGPQSALWGSDALAGVINIVTKEGKKGVQLQAFGEGGSFATGQTGAALRGGGEKYDFALSSSFLRTDGINTSVSGSEKDGYKNITGAAKANIQLFDNLKAGFTGRFTTGRSEFDDAAFGPPTDADLETKRREAYGRLFATLSLIEDAWQNTFSATILDTKADNFLGGVQAPEGTTGQRIKYELLSTLAFQTTVGHTLDHKANFLLERETEKFTQSGTPFTFFGSLFDPNQEQENTANSIAGEYHIGFEDSFYITGAVRFDKNDLFDNQTTYRATASYRLPIIDARLHGSYGTGAKDPTFIDLFGFFPTQFAGNPDLQTETSQGWDIGLERDFFNGRARVDLTYFKANLENEITSIFPLVGLPTVDNDTETSRRQGIEVSIFAEPMENWTLRFSYSHLDATEGGEQEIRRPRTLLSAQSDLAFANGRGNFTVSLDYNGDQRDDDFTFFPATRVVLDSFALLDIAASYDVTDQVTLFGRVENALDSDYQEVFGFETRGVGVFGGIKVNLDWQS